MPEDATDAWWGYVEGIGVDCTHSRALVERLNGDFRAADGGFASLAALPMPQRAVVSDQIVGAAQAVPRNLAEARLHEHDLNSLVANGVRFGSVGTVEAENGIRIDMCAVGFFRAFGSALDCLAAGTIGVLRLPLSIRRASFGRVLNLSDAMASEHRLWQETKDLIVQRSNEPDDWLEWSLEMRHALMHRPRLMSLMLQRESPTPRLVLPIAAFRQIMRERLRFDPHFRRRPWLPDMQHLADGVTAGSLPQAILSEPLTQTVRGIFVAANELIEAVANQLLTVLDEPELADIPLPAREWSLEEDENIVFNGFAPGRLIDVGAGLVSPDDEERMRLASDLANAGVRIGQ